MDGRAFGMGGKADAQPNRRPSCRLGAKMRKLGQQFLAFALQPVDAHVEWRAACQRRTLLGALVAKDARKVRIKPLRIFALYVRRRVLNYIRSECRALRLRQWLGCEPLAAAQRRNRRNVKTALTVQHAQKRRARTFPAHKPS